MLPPDFPPADGIDARDEEVKALGSELDNYLKDNVK